MSEKHLYEKHLAEKLQQISPPPDVEGNWQKMRSLLDQDRPRGGFGKRWWQIGVIAAILLIGGWLVGTQFLQTSEDKTPVVATQTNPANVDQKKLSPDKSQSDKDNVASANGNGNAPANAKANAGTPANSKVDAGKPDAANTSSLPVSAKNEPSTARATDQPQKPGSFAENNRALKTGAPENNRTLATAPDAGKNSSNAPLASSGSKKKNNKPVINADVGNDQQSSLARNNPDRKNKSNKQYTAKNSTKDDLTLHNDKDGGNTNTTVRKPIEYSPVDENTGYANASPSPANNLEPDISLLSLHAKEVLKSKSARAGKSRSEKSFAFGFSLPLAFPLGDQKALSYNFNGGANTVSDYIPSPHVQYRLNKKTYLQTELQFISPQYIRPILLYETRENSAGNYMVYNSIYARKLYYFNLPVGIHHSPFNNFYLGTGLQFSKMLSGVGLYKQTKRSMSGQPISLISERFGKLDGDSLNHRMNTAEVRLMLEMNYYINRFTIGLRYNQAFNNYVNFRIDPMQPFTFDKNKALQFYLRYNLWEDIRRKPNGKGLLSSK